MKKEILEQAVLDYIGEKFKDKVLGKRVQTFFTYSELVDTVLSFAELLNKNIEELEQENKQLKEANQTFYTMNNNMWVELEMKRAESQGITNRLHQLIKAKELLKRCYENYIYLEPLRSEIKQFFK